jgi:hypothetical protein
MQPWYPPTTHDEESLSALEGAFNDTLATLKVDDPFRDWNKDDELRATLAEELRALMARGVTDPDELRVRALENLHLTQNSTFSARAAATPPRHSRRGGSNPT